MAESHTFERGIDLAGDTRPDFDLILLITTLASTPGPPFDFPWRCTPFTF